MKVVVAIDSLKGSLTSLEAGNAIREGVLRTDPEAEVFVRPLADGGEGTVEALTIGMGGQLERVLVTGPLGRPVECLYGIVREQGLAIVEMSGAAGITLVPEAELNPMNATSYGVGEVIRDAISKGCRKFIVGIGGSATNDGGVGMLQALGFGLLRQILSNILPFGKAWLGFLLHLYRFRTCNRSKHFLYLLNSIFPCYFLILRIHTTPDHTLTSPVIHSLTVSITPFARFEERLCASLIYEILVKKTDFGDCDVNRVTLLLYPVLGTVRKVDTQSQFTIIYTHELIIGKESLAHGVYEFLVRNSKELPLPYRPHPIDDIRSTVNLLIDSKRQRSVLYTIARPYYTDNDKDYA